MDLNIQQLEALAELARAKDLAEITITDGDKKITIKTPASVSHTIHQVAGGTMPLSMPTAAPVANSAPSAVIASEAPAVPALEDASLHTVTSPMVGTFYVAASPESPIFAAKGSTVAVGQTLCILEAMKQMNELESDVSGTVVDVLVANGQPVEYGQPLFKIRP
ncbi:MAG: acetyl-CoA carboxylase biotin carboxyl carrier protein [Vampirovibrio sp.]